MLAAFKKVASSVKIRTKESTENIFSHYNLRSWSLPLTYMFGSTQHTMFISLSLLIETASEVSMHIDILDNTTPI